MWTATTAILSVVGRLYTVLRPAFVIELHGDEDLRPHARALFDTIWKLYPADREYRVLGKSSRSYRKLTPGVLAKLRGTLDHVGSERQLYYIKDDVDWNVGQHVLELKFLDHPAGTVHVALPTAFVDDPDAVARLFGELVDTFPFLHATAGYGFAMEWAREGEMKGMPAAIQAGRRFLGLGVRNRTEEDLLYWQMKSAHWLTFVNQRLLADLGPEPPGVDRSVGRHGVVLRAGRTPPIGDVEQGAPDIAPMRSVNRWLRPLRIQEWNVAGSNLFFLPKAEADAWLTRLDSPEAP